MNQNGDEKRIQQLFREMSDDDCARTPAFSRVVHGASSRVSPFRAGKSRRLALAFAALCVIVIALTITSLRRVKPDGSSTANEIASDERRPTQAQPDTPLPEPVPLVKKPVIQMPVSVDPRRRTFVHVRRHRKAMDELAIAMKLSSWRSPTASLFKTAPDDKLMSLPKLGESLKTLRSYSLDDLD